MVGLCRFRHRLACGHSLERGIRTVAAARRCTDLRSGEQDAATTRPKQGSVGPGRLQLQEFGTDAPYVTSVRDSLRGLALPRALRGLPVVVLLLLALGVGGYFLVGAVRDDSAPKASESSDGSTTTAETSGESNETGTHQLTTSATTVAAGQPGPRGPIGARGPAGSKGDRGSPGPRGRAGAAGSGGATGATGATGAAGAAGSRGATGTRGATGAAGATGAKGATGAQGATGPAGARGPTGAIGAQGTTGATGAKGA